MRDTRCVAATVAQGPDADPGLSFASAARLVLGYLNDHLPLAVWSVTRVENDQQTHLVLNEGNVYDITRGGSTPWQDTFCVHMVEGRTPAIAVDALAVPEYRLAAERLGMDIGTYAGAPIRESDGSLFGVICGFDPERHDGDAALAAAAPLLTMCSQVLTLALESDRNADALRRALESASQAAATDALTGLGNRRSWAYDCQTTAMIYDDLADPTVVLMVDLDGLKAVNDTRGHDAGDRYIQACAGALQTSVRPTDAVARLGGDEFGVILRNCSEREAASIVERIRGELADAGVSASLGVCHLTVTDGLAGALAIAEERMYADKVARRAGR